jgi:HNH endonuclease
MDTSIRAWTVIALDPENRQYGGNLGHIEDHQVMYRYDKDVANHKRVREGDLLFIRDRQELLGIARIQKISVETAEKVRQRCPTCKNTDIKERSNPTLPWRCKNGHEFAKPLLETVATTRYTASYPDKFIPAVGLLTTKDLKAAAPGPNDQFSIEAIDIALLGAQLSAAPAEIRDRVESLVQRLILLPGDAAEPDDDPDSFVWDGVDRREKTLAAIRRRRGQRAFRDKLRVRYEDKCVVTDCALVDLLEAAHIDPFRSDVDHHAANGLLLRADMHTLFDLYLMSIDPEGLTVALHPQALSAGYGNYEGKVLFNNGKTPSKAALGRHWQMFLERLEESVTAASSA